MEPIKVHVTVTLTSDELITLEDLQEIRKTAQYRYSQGGLSGLDDDTYVSTLINECVESKLVFDLMAFDDFDWTGPKWETLLDAVRGLDEDGEPIPPPEIFGQIDFSGGIVGYA